MATIHLVIVADNKDAKIGVSVDTDLRRVKDNFFEYAEMCNMHTYLPLPFDCITIPTRVTSTEVKITRSFHLIPG